MPTIIIDEKQVQCRDGVPVLQAALEAGWDVPHYCYHPGLSIVASCRLCLMEIKLPHPKTHELDWSPKLLPSCQTPVREGMEVRFASQKVTDNQESCMEFFLLNHPLDCPVCDKAGECYLQDYSYKFGHATSRMVDQKLKNPKKNVGPKTLLYQDRCVMCSRCVRFTQEIAGTSELCIVNRGSRLEIDVFPGLPLDNPLQGNVVDICPVGALLDKDFLFKRRVWELRSTKSVCPLCATGCTIDIDAADNKVYRLKPRENPKVNGWWICDEGRFGWKYTHDEKRIAAPRVKRGTDWTTPPWQDIPDVLRYRVGEFLEDHPASELAVVLSPFMSCEEAWLLLTSMRAIAPDCALVKGPIPYQGEDQKFPTYINGKSNASTNGNVKFTILAEKCPNRRGIEMLLEWAGRTVLDYDDFIEKAGKGEFKGAWIVGGYPSEWVQPTHAKAAAKIDLLIVQDMFESGLLDNADVVLPACSWAERDGCFINAAGVIQPFERAINPPEGAMRDGQYLFAFGAYEGLYTAARVRELMAEDLPAFASDVYAPPPKPKFAH